MTENVTRMTAHLLPPPPGTCPACAVKHPPELPHNAQSLFYQQAFHARHGRWPTWADAIAHCSPEMQKTWRTELQARNAWTEPDAGIDPIAMPPAETERRLQDMDEYRKL